ncbi:lipin Ned1 [Coemansia sp. RSA 2049]|nr:lipin Ned1 [Coemansia sp. RSA 2049]
MQYVGKVFSTVSQLYKELNPATLSGAIDVVVVEGKDGELACSPFHVRFGKLQLLRPSDKAVQIIVNDKPADFYMKVSDSGEAFFVLETESDVPSQFATSPVASPALSFRQNEIGDPDFLDLSGNVRAVEDHHANDGYVSAPSAHETDSDTDDDLLHRLGDGPLIAGRQRSSTLSEDKFSHSHDDTLESDQQQRRQRQDQQSDQQQRLLSQSVPKQSQRPLSVVSDSEFFIKDAASVAAVSSASEQQPSSDWDWGVKLDSVLPLQQHHKDLALTLQSQNQNEQQNIQPLDLLQQRFEVSLCGIESLQKAADDADEKKHVFDSARVHQSMFHSDPVGIISSTALVFRTSEGAYIEGATMLASLVGQLAFGSSGTTGSDSGSSDDQDEINRVGKEPSDAAGTTPNHQQQNQNRNQQQQQQQQQQTPGAQRRWWRWGGGGGNGNTSVNGNGALDTEDAIRSAAADQPTPVGDMLGYMSDDGLVPHPVRTEHEHKLKQKQKQNQNQNQSHNQNQPNGNVHYAKTLRLTSEQLKSLGLRRGANDVKFLVASNNAYCEARIFLYQHDTQIVISDIDGTITKSDALGHLFNMVGKDWTHMGVARLYSDLVSNGYEIIYLTARAIGQADGTRYFLSNVRQGDSKLPLGPLLLSPDRLFTSFHREVIKRRPHEFKMACLRDIKNLFGGTSPFYAGFGNRITDAMSYRSVNVPVSRICTIDTTGVIKLDLLPGYRSSYVKMNDLVDMMFPALSTKLDPTFNDWEYWKPEFPSIDDELAAFDLDVGPVNPKSTEFVAEKPRSPHTDPGHNEDGELAGIEIYDGEEGEEEDDEGEEEEEEEEEEEVDPDMLAIMHDMEQVQHV